METYEDDDDTHFCIKCHLTVNGLENYVRHRQSGCRPPEVKQEAAHDPPITPTTVTYPEILNADAFFSSLELQSSAKSNPTPRTRSLIDRERKPGKSEDKKKKVRRGQEHDDGGAKEKLLNMPPVVTDLDDFMDHLGIPSLVGFPDIVTSTANKSSAVAPSKSACSASSSKPNNDDNLRDSPLEGLMTSSKGSSERKRNTDSQRIEQDHGEWLEDTILADLDANSESKEAEHGELTTYAEYDYQQDEESEDESPEEEEIGDEDSYSDDDYVEDREYPEHGHTGGKWKPSELLQDISRLNEDELEQDDDNQEHPPIQHTGGKWKPADSSQLQRVETEDEVAGKDPGTSSLTPSAASRQRPPPGHTRGKWIPGAAGDLGSGYWCDPCGRKLASRLLYNRHLLSELHARRSIQEIEGDLQLPRGVGPLLQRKSASKRQRALAEIKSRSKVANPEENKGTAKKKTRRREKEVLWCEMCHARVRRPQMGKHLLSHYHCRVAGTNPCSSPAARRFILENMGNVVRQCPFQCASCRFYCNTEETFLLHWRSKFHATRFDDAGGNYKCTACNFWCTENETMEHHLQSSGHREVVAMMNGAVPVVVRRQRSLVCETCNQHFRYNVQLRLHVRETGHRGNSTAADDYQSKIACGLCSQVVRSLVALQRHQLSCHGCEENVEDEETKVIVQPSAPYFCSFCTLNFTTAREAVLHRRTPRHKEIVKAQKLSAENIGSLGRECPHCDAKQWSLVEHREHLLERHPELCHRCPRCGVLFALPQDVTRHTRTVQCAKTITDDVERVASNDEEWRCSNCPFVTDSQAEFIFHDALHAGRIDASADEAGSSKASAKYRCPMCEKSFPKGSLRNHIRSHTGERPFRCAKCSASFPRRSGLNAHRKECAASSTSSLSWPKGGKFSRQRNHTCSECNIAFYTNRVGSRYVSYQEVYTRRAWGMFKRLATRINYRWETYNGIHYVDECCPGYEPQGIETSTCHPLCERGCENGRCIHPNICECNLGYRSVMTVGHSHCVPRCSMFGGLEGCGDHGLCTAPNTCDCHKGYSFNVTSGRPCIPKCETECGENSFCLSPNNCVCNAGYTRIGTEISSALSFNCGPSCVPECGSNMNCYAPNKCQCNAGYLASTSPDVILAGNYDRPKICSPVCDPPCIDGTCTRPGYCECHKGYKKNLISSSQICLPDCDPPCTNATCTRPNYCECHNGYQKISTHLPQVCSPLCDPPCIDGTCTKPGYCECHNGYKKDLKSSSQICLPDCDPPCTNATCTRPNYCECHNGYQKISTHLPQVCSPLCDPPCIDGTCTKPGYCECHNGYKKDLKSSSQVCLPDCDPPCTNATCTRPNHCECHDGYEKKLDVLPQLCSPVCNPICDPNSFCDAPNKCLCNNGYTVATINSSSVTTANPLQPIGTSTFNSNEISCKPVCESDCKENESCVAPNVCQCHSGYRPDVVEANLIQCRPICEQSCVNAYCGYPNKCICLSGYTPSLVEDFVCEPVCQDGCFNATCTLPNHCECYDGYEKVLTPIESPDVLNFAENTCVPSCPGQCRNGTCIAPGQCLCDPGYVLNSTLLTFNETMTDYAEDSNSTTITNATSIQFCQPFCEPGCPIGSECFSPNQCEPQPDDTQDFNESSINTTHVINTIEDCGRNGDYLDENDKCVCKYGWTGWRCEKPSLCGLLIMVSPEGDDKSTTLQSIINLSNDTIEPTYGELDDMRMMSGDESGVTIDWQGPMCVEECRMFMTSSEISGNRSDEVTCYLLESENDTTGVLSIREQALLPGSQNGTLVCFISIGSECNSSELKISGGTFGSLGGGIIGAIILIALVTVGLAIYCRKNRAISFTPAVSMSNSTMLIHPDSMNSLHITDSSNL